MLKILTRSFFEAILAPLLTGFAVLFVVACLCWPLILLFMIDGQTCSSAVVVVLSGTQLAWWCMAALLAVQLVIVRDSQRTDFTAHED